MEKIKWGIIGPGSIANNFADGLTSSYSGQLVGIASNNYELRISFGDKYDIHEDFRFETYDDIINSEHIDAIYISTPHTLHAEWTIKAVRQSAEEAGRNPDELTICVVAPAYVGDDLPHQRDQVRWFGGMVGNHVADLVKRYGSDGSLVPEALTEYIKAREGYDYSEHGRAGNTHTDFVPDEIIDRFCILGDVSSHIEKLSELRALGVDQFAIYLMHDQQDETLEVYGQSIIPVFNK